MQVTVFSGIIESASMYHYTNGVIAGIREFGHGIEVKEVRPSLEDLGRRLPGGRLALGVAKYLYRYVWYPWRARALQGDVNHVTDHAHAHLIARLEPSRTIVTCHDLISFVQPENMNTSALFPSIGTRALEYSVGHLHRAARVIADSENTKRDLMKFTRCAPERIVVIHPGVDPHFYGSQTVADGKAFRELNNLGSDVLLLHVGHNGPYKNIETVLGVVAALRDDWGLPVRLVKVGNSFTDNQERLIAHLGLEDRITHLGWLPRDALVQTYRSSDLLLFPSLYEGFGWPPLEAMASGLPVVTSSAGSIPEVVGDAAIMLDPLDQTAIVEAVASVLNNEALREEMVSEGRRHTNKFTWERSIARLLEVYREVYAENGGVA